jgi:hypothetical protein
VLLAGHMMSTTTTPDADYCLRFDFSSLEEKGQEEKKEEDDDL